MFDTTRSKGLGGDFRQNKNSLEDSRLFHVTLCVTVHHKVARRDNCKYPTTVVIIKGKK